MFFGLYPIIPTSEADTLTFLQKLEIINYKLKKVTDRTGDLETTVASLGERIEAVADSVPTVEATTNDDGSLAALFINGDSYPVNEPLSGNCTIYDDNDHSFTGKYVMTGNQLSLSFGSDVIGLSGSSFHISGLPLLYISGYNAAASVFYGVTASNITTYSFVQLYLIKGANSAVATLTFGTTKGLSIALISGTETATAFDPAAAFLSAISNRAITFMI